jgi:hypothetical protein
MLRFLCTRADGDSGPRSAAGALVMAGVLLAACQGPRPSTQEEAQSTAEKERNAALITATRLLPEEAVEKVKKPEFGKVTDIRLENTLESRTVWSITLATINPRADPHVPGRRSHGQGR